MLISAVVITVAYNSLEMFGLLNKRFSSNNEKNSGIVTFDRLFLQDMEKSTAVLKNGDGLRCQYVDKEIFYEFYPKEIYRTFLQTTDTFRFPASNPVFLFEQQTQEQDAGFVDEVHLEYMEDDEQQIFMYRKDYGPDVLLNE